MSQFNEELVHKQRLLAISKADMLDEEMMKQMVQELPSDIPHVFISSVSGFNIQKLKDMLWKEIKGTK